jgi:indole-3-glycerol phosphate synthase
MIKDCPDILKKIVETKKSELKHKKYTIKELEVQISEQNESLDFEASLKKEKLAVISEIKKASPSAGIINENFQPEKIARAYMQGEADAVSILTDKEYFKGNIEYIKNLREIITVPVLRKDFIIDEYQIYEARAYGADTFLLIAAILTTDELKQFIETGRNLGMEPLVESHNENELKKSIDAGTKIFGINNRNLHTFEVDINTSLKLFDLIPDNAVKVAESGIKNIKDADLLRKTGFNAVLIGETLMRCGLDSVPEMVKKFQVS